MEDSKSNTSDDEDHFFDAPDEFPFYDCVDTDESDQPISHASSISRLAPIEPIAEVLLKPKSPPEISSPTGLRRRRSFSHHIRKDISGNDSKRSNSDLSVSFETNQTHEAIATSTTAPRERKYRFSRSLKENEGESGKSDSIKVRFSSGRVNDSVNEENIEISTITAANGERIDESVTVDSRPGEIDESSSNFLFILAKFVIRAIGFQINLLVSFFTFPIWILYCSYMFVIDPFRVVRRGREYLTGKLWRVWGVVNENVTPLLYEWLKEHKSTWMLALRFGWGLLWSVYVCFILVSLLVLAFVVSGFMMRFLVEEPIQMKETLNFDYTKNSPVALVPVMSCSDVSSNENDNEKIEVGKIGGPRVVPANHKLQATVSLTLPESDYNRNLGIFQVKVDFLSANDKALASSRRPCMLQFKSQPIRLLLTFLKVAPLIAGYLSESQTLDLKFSGFVEGEMPTTCLRVIIEQRAEYRPGAGIPEIYAASLKLESELPLLKRILWYWKKTIFIWISMMIFTMEIFFTLLCCKSIIIPRVRLRDGSANNSAPQNNLPVQR